MKRCKEFANNATIMKKLLYFEQDSSRIRPIVVALSKHFEVSVAGDLLELAATLRQKEPRILLFGLASLPGAFSIHILDRIKQIMLNLHKEKLAPRSALSVVVMHENDSRWQQICEPYIAALREIPFCDIYVIPAATNPDELAVSIINIKRANRHLRTARMSATAEVPIIGNSTKMRHVIEQIRTYADKHHPVLIVGETGTGKELAARALHFWGKRSHHHFVALNCATIPETLFESEMFGTERGAYTDASTRMGAIEQADNGTLFLDEIGSLSLASQPRLLRVLETGEYRRLGDPHPHSAQFRLVSASCINPIDLAAKNKFRSDLVYRIADLVIEIPPLRHRAEDIPLLAAHFCSHFSKDAFSLEQNALDKLCAYHWPGNVRELRSVIARACANNSTGRIFADDIQFLYQWKFEGNSQPEVSA